MTMAVMYAAHRRARRCGIRRRDIAFLVRARFWKFERLGLGAGFAFDVRSFVCFC